MLNNFIMNNKSILKLHELIKHCIKYGARGDGQVFKTKLAKLVYLADFKYYYDNLKSITELLYTKKQFGPITNGLFDELDSMLDTAEIKMIPNPANSSTYLYSLNSDLKQEYLSDQELETVKLICKKWKNSEVKEIVDFTHKQLPWKISFMGDTINYSLITQEDPDNVY